jgi:hypothetical protein
MTDEMSNAELDEIEQRAARAVRVAPPPWTSWPGHVTTPVDAVSSTQQPLSPDPRLDAIVDFLGNAAADVPR